MKSLKFGIEENCKIMKRNKFEQFYMIIPQILILNLLKRYEKTIDKE